MNLEIEWEHVKELYLDLGYSEGEATTLAWFALSGEPLPPWWPIGVALSLRAAAERPS